jgi:hypothetical protein
MLFGTSRVRRGNNIPSPSTGEGKGTGERLEPFPRPLLPGRKGHRLRGPVACRTALWERAMREGIRHVASPPTIGCM